MILTEARLKVKEEIELRLVCARERVQVRADGECKESVNRFET